MGLYGMGNRAIADLGKFVDSNHYNGLRYRSRDMNCALVRYIHLDRGLLNDHFCVGLQPVTDRQAMPAEEIGCYIL